MITSLIFLFFSVCIYLGGPGRGFLESLYAILAGAFRAIDHCVSEREAKACISEQEKQSPEKPGKEKKEPKVGRNPSLERKVNSKKVRKSCRFELRLMVMYLTFEM